MRQLNSGGICGGGLCLLAFLVFMMTIPTRGVGAQSLDEIERQIEAAKRENAARAASEARLGTLVIRTDVTCRLTVNGTDRGEVSSGSARSVRVPAGEQLIECASTEPAGVGYQGVKELAAGTQSVVLIELAGNVARAERERVEKAAASRSQLRVPAPVADDGTYWWNSIDPDNGSARVPVVEGDVAYADVLRVEPEFSPFEDMNGKSDRRIIGYRVQYRYRGTVKFARISYDPGNKLRIHTHNLSPYEP